MQKIDISIIIATRNRETILWQTVEKAVTAIEGLPAEIIAVNDGDQPLQMPLAFHDKITCFNNPVRGVSSARNYGVTKSSGNVLFFVDDDMWLNKESIQWIIRKMQDDNNKTSVYNLNWEYPASLNEALAKTNVGKFILSTNYNTMWGRMHKNVSQPADGLYKYDTIGSCSLVMHIKIFKALQGYNESLVFQGEDVDLSNRINDLAIPILCVFDTTLHHNHADRLDLKGYLERINNGYRSQFMAEKAGLIFSSVTDYKGWKMPFFEFFRLSEKAFTGLYQLIPEHRIFIALTNKLTGLLSGLQRYKQWRVIIGNKK